MICVRAMGRADIDAVYEIEQLSFRTPWSRAALLGELKNDVAVYRLLVADGAVAGYCGMWLLFDEAHITNIAVRPELRGQGYGKLMLAASMRTAANRSAGRMTLEVRENNRVAQNMYAAFDFVQAGRRRGYYQDTGEDALILWNESITDTLLRQQQLFTRISDHDSMY